jgi:3-isopropylmalate/(R)-2-methylmalate dehydratase large subunit
MTVPRARRPSEDEVEHPVAREGLARPSVGNGATVAEKILARKSGRDHVAPGEIVWCDVDLAMVHDSSGPRRLGPMLERLGATIWDPSKVVIATDHFVPPNDQTEVEIARVTREFARDRGVAKYHEAEGICHIVPLERGYVIPGTLFVGADSHSTTAGVMGAFAVPVGVTEMLGVFVTGQIWLKVPETTRIEWTGPLAEGCMAKDMVLTVLGEIGDDGATYQALEYGGDAVYALPFDERIVLTNMAIEHGAKTGIIPPDELVFGLVRGRGRDTAAYPDPDAIYARVLRHRADELAPRVALPGAPDNVADAAEAKGERIDQAYIGACTGAKYTDLAAVARVVRGRRVAPGVRFLIAPASKDVMRRAAESGVLATLLGAGATLLPTGCGACAGLGHGVLGAGERCISSTNRNYPGRMGHALAQVFLGSPLTVAASAVTGTVTDPRELLA